MRNDPFRPSLPDSCVDGPFVFHYKYGMSQAGDYKVIDFHIHIGLKEHWHTWVHDYQRAAGCDLYEFYEDLIDPKKFAAYLAGCGLEKAVILPENNPLVTGTVPDEYVLEFCRNADILIPFCTVNPTLDENPAQKIKKYVNRGAKGIKLYPSYGHFFPNDRALYPVYELAQERGLPVLVHTGSSVFKGAKMKYADPLHLDDVAADFPECYLVMAHGGRGIWYKTAFFLSRLHPNLFLEISGLPPKNLLTYFPDLDKNIDKVIYGSDWPGVKSVGINIGKIKKLPLPQKDLKKILYHNAARILGLNT